MLRKSSITLLALAAILAVTHVHPGAALAAGTMPASAPAKSQLKATGGKSASQKHWWNKVDLNSASREDLMKLPGVGEATADKIIADRPYKTKAELVSKGVVTKKEFSAISMRVVARQEVATTSK